MARDHAIELTGETVVLRPFHADDDQAIYAAVRESMSELGRWLSWCHADYAIDDTRAFLEARGDAYERDGELAFAIDERESGRLLGAAGLNQIERAALRQSGLLAAHQRHGPRLCHRSGPPAGPLGAGHQRFRAGRNRGGRGKPGQPTRRRAGRRPARRSGPQTPARPRSAARRLRVLASARRLSAVAVGKHKRRGLSRFCGAKSDCPPLARAKQSGSPRWPACWRASSAICGRSGGRLGCNCREICRT